MKKWWILGAAIVAFSTQLSAQNYHIEETRETFTPAGNYIPENIDGPPPQAFWSIEADYDWIAKSRFKDSTEKISFQQLNTQIYYTKFLNPCDALSAGIGYQYTHLGWDENPYFGKEDFNDILFSVSGLTRRLPGWEWQLNFTTAVDLDHFSFSDYALYTFTVWGKYQPRFNFCRDLTFHLGVIGRTGLRDDLVLPIIGVDFPLWKRVHVHLVFPVDMSIDYTLNCNWSISLGGKYWNNRHRADKNEVVPKAIYEYRNLGLELGLNYEYCEFIAANIHAGYTVCDGTLEINDSHDNRIVKKRFRPAPYVGGSFLFRF